MHVPLSRPPPCSVTRLVCLLGLAAGVSGALQGCGGGAGGRTRPSVSLDEGRELFKSSGRTQSAGRANAEAEYWTILIQAFQGEDRHAQAEEMLAGVRGDGALPEAYTEDRADTTIVAYGRYASPDDPRTIAELQRIQQMSFAGLRPYATARLLPPMVEGSVPELDLRRAKEIHGSDALYTLQVAVYSPEDRQHPTPGELADFRQLAEQAAAILRQQGELAFYYHGPSRSTVTVDVFGAEDMDASGVESMRLREARKRHPYNLLNGRGIKGRQTKTTSSGAQKTVEQLHPSLLVAIPDK